MFSIDDHLGYEHFSLPCSWHQRCAGAGKKASLKDFSQADLLARPAYTKPIPSPPRNRTVGAATAAALELRDDHIGTALYQFHKASMRANTSLR